MEFKNENFQLNSLKNSWNIVKENFNFNRNCHMSGDRQKIKSYVGENTLFEMGTIFVLVTNESLPFIKFLMAKWRLV